MKISIAMCTYNGAGFVAEQLRSFAEQSLLPDEVVVCDDCSSDETVCIVRQFAAGAPFAVRLFVNAQNLRSTKNFEKAISLCGGEIIFLADQDDVWMPNKISRIAAEFEKSEEIGMVFSDAELVGEQLESFDKTLWEYSFDADFRRKALRAKLSELIITEHNMVTGATMAFRARFRQSFLPIPEGSEDFIHDAWLALVISSQAKVVFLKEPLIKYRQHSGQQIGIGTTALEKLAENQNPAKPRAAKKAVSENVFEDSINRYRGKKKLLAYLEKTLPAELKAEKFPKKILDELMQTIDSEKKLVDQAGRHLEMRKNLPPAKHRRFYPVAKDLLSGNYHKFGRGFPSAAKDLLKK